MPPGPTPDPDLAVIGGGLSGAVLAARQASRGRRVLLLEREAGPHDKVCGEFLSHEALSALRVLGVDPFRLGAVPVHRVRVHAGRRCAEALLPFRGASLSRRVLDQVLLEHAAACGASLRRGYPVRALRRLAPDAWRLSVADTGIDVPAVALATGKHDLRLWPRPPGRQNDLVGFKTYLRLSPAARRVLDAATELHLLPGGYAGLQPTDGDRATLCLVVPRVLAATGWLAVLRTATAASPALASRLADAGFLLSRPLAIARIPYGLLAPAADDRARPVWRLGDQAAVIPSLSGDGMAIALHAARLADLLLAAGAAPDALSRALRRDLLRPVRLATLLSRLATTPRLQLAATVLLDAVPALLPLLADLTRIPVPALRRAAAPTAAIRQQSVCRKSTPFVRDTTG